MELLAPAGGMEQLKAALRFGADAVYGGMKQYGLRAFAGNFDEAALAEAAELCHRQGAKFYVTMNILPTDKELDGFAEAGKTALRCGADAAIVSDLGACLILHERVPGLPIHISTQANVMNAPTALHLHRAVGAERIVLSRELSMEDIRGMRALLPSELELEGEEAFRRAVPDLMRELNKASHRKSNTGFYFGAPQPVAGAEGFSQTMEYVGDVLEAAVPDEPALIRLKNRFYVGDELEALTPTGSHPFTVESMMLAETGESIQTASVAGTLLRLRFPFPVAPGDLLRGPNRNHQQG